MISKEKSEGNKKSKIIQVIISVQTFVERVMRNLIRKKLFDSSGDSGTESDLLEMKKRTTTISNIVRTCPVKKKQKKKKKKIKK